VLHDNEVTYAVIAPAHGESFAGSVLQSYQSIADILRATLNGLGIAAQLVPGQRQGGARDPIKAVCFTAPSQYELLVEQCKVAGSAQKRQGDAFLQHGSIPIEMDLELLDRILPGESGVSALQRFATVGWLNRWATTPLTIAAVEQALIETFADLQQVDWQRGGLNAAEQMLADSLCAEKYGNPSWTEKKP
jgi:lipoate-protein ligase A